MNRTRRSRLRKVAAGDLGECIRLLEEFGKQLGYLARGLERVTRSVEAARWRIAAADESDSDPSSPSSRGEHQ